MRALPLVLVALALATLAAASAHAQDVSALPVGPDAALPTIAPPTPALPPLEPMSDLPEIGGGRPLSLADVLASVEAHHPTIDAARARLDAAAGAHLAAEGGFDPMLSASGWVAPLGYYQWGRADVSLSQATPFWGARFIGGWRIGREIDSGGIPDYYGNYATSEAGEVRVGVTVPLWRDGPIDSRRAGIARTERAEEAAGRDLQARVLRLRLAAAQSYYRWVADGQKAAIALELLRLAEERDRQIGARVAAGAIPAIEHLENRRAIFERRQAVIAARRTLEQRALALALYLRDEGGAPRVAPSIRVPSEVPILALPAGGEDDLVAVALEARPELARYEALTAAARVQIDLAENQIAPRIDLSALGSFDLGDGARQYTEPVLETWILFQLPLGMREARGRADTARADLRALEADRELQADQIRLEVRDALSAVRAAREGLELAIATAEVAEQVARGERTRFENGATSLLIVNLREAAAAQARAAVAEAEAALRTAHVWLSIAVGADVR